MTIDELTLSPEDRVRVDFLLALKDKIVDLVIKDVLEFGKDDPNLGGMLSGMFSSIILDMEVAYPTFAREVVLALSLTKLQEMGLDPNVLGNIAGGGSPNPNLN